MSDRTFTVTTKGDDVKAWQGTLNGILKSWEIDLRLERDGIYGVGTRSVTNMVAYAMGFNSKHLMRNGVTPWLREKIRNRRRTVKERWYFAQRLKYRAGLRKRYKRKDVARIVNKVTVDSWGWAPGHDGIDICTPPNAPLYAPVKCKVIRVDAGGWWGKAPTGDFTIGDGIIVLEVIDVVGPYFKGLKLCYGHAEKATVKEGQVVKAGEMIGRAGFANAWHTHWMVHNRRDDRGIGDRNPRPFYDYAQKKG